MYPKRHQEGAGDRFDWQRQDTAPHNKHGVRNDSTFSYNGKRYLIENKIYQRRVMIETRLDGRTVVRTKTAEFKYREIGMNEKIEAERGVISEVSKQRMKEKPYWGPHALNHKKIFENLPNPHGG